MEGTNAYGLKIKFSNPRHVSSFAKTVTTFCASEKYMDLMLICKENKVVKANKVILASVSTFIADVVNNITDDILYICLPDVHQKTLEILLSLLYTGSSKLNHEEFVSLKETLSFLQINLPDVDILSDLQDDPGDICTVTKNITAVTNYVDRTLQDSTSSEHYNVTEEPCRVRSCAVGRKKASSNTTGSYYSAEKLDNNKIGLKDISNETVLELGQDQGDDENDNEEEDRSSSVKECDQLKSAMENSRSSSEHIHKGEDYANLQKKQGISSSFNSRTFSEIKPSQKGEKFKKRKMRFRETQTAILEKEFIKNRCPNSRVKDRLAEELGLPVTKVSHWFSKRREMQKGSKKFSRFEIALLKKEYKKNAFPNRESQERLASILGLTYEEVSAWFKHKNLNQTLDLQENETMLLPDPETLPKEKEFKATEALSDKDSSTSVLRKTHSEELLLLAWNSVGKDSQNRQGSEISICDKGTHEQEKVVVLCPTSNDNINWNFHNNQDKHICVTENNTYNGEQDPLAADVFDKDNIQELGLPYTYLHDSTANENTNFDCPINGYVISEGQICVLPHDYYNGEGNNSTSDWKAVEPTAQTTNSIRESLTRVLGELSACISNDAMKKEHNDTCMPSVNICNGENDPLAIDTMCDASTRADIKEEPNLAYVNNDLNLRPAYDECTDYSIKVKEEQQENFMCSVQEPLFHVINNHNDWNSTESGNVPELSYNVISNSLSAYTVESYDMVHTHDSLSSLHPSTSSEPHEDFTPQIFIHSVCSLLGEDVIEQHADSANKKHIADENTRRSMPSELTEVTGPCFIETEHAVSKRTVTVTGKNDCITEEIDSTVPVSERKRIPENDRILLESEFRRNAYPSREIKQKLARKLQYPLSKVNIWFLNRRQKSRCMNHKIDKGIDTIRNTSRLKCEGAQHSTINDINNITKKTKLSEKNATEQHADSAGKKHIADENTRRSRSSELFDVTRPCFMETEPAVSKQNVTVTGKNDCITEEIDSTASVSDFQNNEYEVASNGTNGIPDSGSNTTRRNLKRTSKENKQIFHIIRERKRIPENDRILLESEFRRNAYPSREIKQKLARKLQYPLSKVNIWFFNRRQKSRCMNHKIDKGEAIRNTSRLKCEGAQHSRMNDINNIIKKTKLSEEDATEYGPDSASNKNIADENTRRSRSSELTDVTRPWFTDTEPAVFKQTVTVADFQNNEYEVASNGANGIPDSGSDTTRQNLKRTSKENKKIFHIIRERKRVPESDRIVLESEFRRNTYPSRETKQKIARKLQYPLSKVNIWFHNRRKKSRCMNDKIDQCLEARKNASELNFVGARHSIVDSTNNITKKSKLSDAQVMCSKMLYVRLVRYIPPSDKVKPCAKTTTDENNESLNTNYITKPHSTDHINEKSDSASAIYSSESHIVASTGKPNELPAEHVFKPHINASSVEEHKSLSTTSEKNKSSTVSIIAPCTRDSQIEKSEPGKMNELPAVHMFKQHINASSVEEHKSLSTTSEKNKSSTMSIIAPCTRDFQIEKNGPLSTTKTSKPGYVSYEKWLDYTVRTLLDKDSMSLSQSCVGNTTPAHGNTKLDHRSDVNKSLLDTNTLKTCNSNLVTGEFADNISPSNSSMMDILHSVEENKHGSDSQEDQKACNFGSTASSNTLLRSLLDNGRAESINNAQFPLCAPPVFRAIYFEEFSALSSKNSMNPSEMQPVPNQNLNDPLNLVMSNPQPLKMMQSPVVPHSSEKTDSSFVLRTEKANGNPCEEYSKLSPNSPAGSLLSPSSSESEATHAASDAEADPPFSECFVKSKKPLSKQNQTKVFKCDACSAVYNVLSDLISHIETHAEEGIYSCEACRVKFSVSCFMNHHRQYACSNV